MNTRIVNADCLDSTTGIPSLPDFSVDMIITSPPYDAIRDYHGFTLSLEDVGRECFRVLKDGGMMAMVIQDQTKDFGKSLTTFRTAVQFVDHIGFKLFESVIYERFGKPGAWWSKRFRVDHEYILLFLKGAKPKFFDKTTLMIPAIHAGKEWAGTQRLTNGSFIPIEKKTQAAMKCRGTIWHYASSNSERDKLKLQHPATFPDKLVEDLITCFTQEDNVILDPFVGSGTTCVVAQRLKRNSIGFEISEEWASLAERRINP